MKTKPILQVVLAAANLVTIATAAELIGNPGIEPVTRQFLQAVHGGGGRPIQELPVSQARAVLDQAQAGQIPLAPAEVERHELPVSPSGKVPVRIVRPAGVTGPLPVVVYFHGGGWILGNFGTHQRLVRDLAAKARAAVVFVEFSPSPEARYPVAIEEAYAVTRHLATHGGDFGLDGTRIAIAGDSVGGNMAAVVALLAKERGGPRIALQVLFYPVTDADFDTGSYREFARGHFLTRDAMKWFWDAYADPAQRQLPTVSPLRADNSQLGGLPPAVVITAENDVLRDDGEAYARKLAAAGVEVVASRFNGTIHDFVMLNALASTPAARGAVELAGLKLQKALH